MQKFLLVLLVLSTGFALSGVSAVVLAQVKEKSVNELTSVSSVDERREVRLVIDSSELINEDINGVSEQVELEESEGQEEDNINIVVSEEFEEEVGKLVKSLEEETRETDESKVLSKLSRAKPATESVFTVPFYSQFADITPTNWKKVSCGIAGVAMLIDFYSEETVSADALLQRGIAAGAFLSDAGWTHQGLINLTKVYGLNGQSHSLSGSSMEVAFNKLKDVLEEGPVMASVHYTFQPTNPIPHLVVVNGVKNGKVFYNDPAEKSGGGSISIAQFQSAWKKRYIEIRPTI